MELLWIVFYIWAFILSYGMPLKEFLIGLVICAIGLFVSGTALYSHNSVSVGTAWFGIALFTGFASGMVSSKGFRWLVHSTKKSAQK